MSSEQNLEFTGATVEEAIQAGLKQLRVGPSQVIVEVIEEPSRGLFGLGSKRARVRLQPLTPPPSAAPPPKPPSTAEEEKGDQPAADTIVEHTSEPGPVADDETVYYGDDDDFFDDDGSYGEHEEVPSGAATAPASRPASEQHEDKVQAVEEPSHQDEDDRQTDDAAEGQARDQQSPRGRGNVSLEGTRKRRRRGRRRSRSKDRDGKPQSKQHSQPVTHATPPIEFEDPRTGWRVGEQILAEMIDILDIPGTVEITTPESSDAGEESPHILNIAGQEEDLHPLIGRKGETLTALQYLTRLMVSKQVEARANIIVDVDEYRLKRSEKIANLANRMADQAVETGMRVSLEPMPPHERRIIHVTLRKRDDVDTESTGEGSKRRVNIFPTD